MSVEKLKMKISNKEKQEIAFAVGILKEAAEIYLEGKMLNTEGEEKLDEAIRIIDKYEITNEEIGIYVRGSKKDNIKCSTTNSLRYNGVM